MGKSVIFSSMTAFSGLAKATHAIPYSTLQYVNLCNTVDINTYITALELVGELGEKDDLVKLHEILHGNIDLLEGAGTVYLLPSNTLGIGINGYATFYAATDGKPLCAVSTEPYPYQVCSKYIAIPALENYDAESGCYSTPFIFDTKTPFSNYVDFELGDLDRTCLDALVVYAYHHTYTPGRILPSSALVAPQGMLDSLDIPLYTNFACSLDRKYLSDLSKSSYCLGVPSRRVHLNKKHRGLKLRGETIPTNVYASDGVGDWEDLLNIVDCASTLLLVYQEGGNTLRLYF